MRLSVARWACLGLFAAGVGCGESSGPPLRATTQFLVDFKGGNAASSALDPLYQTRFAIEVVFPSIDASRGSMSDTAECKSTTVASFPAERTASGESAEL